MAIVKEVYNYIKLNDEEIDKVFRENKEKINFTEKQITRWHKKCLCLVEFTDVQKIDNPLVFEKQTNMDDWLILNKIEDVVKGSSIPFNYNNSKF